MIRSVVILVAVDAQARRSSGGVQGRAPCGRRRKASYCWWYVPFLACSDYLQLWSVRPGRTAHASWPRHRRGSTQLMESGRP